VDYQERLYPSDYDQHELDPLLLLDWYHFLVLRKDFQKVDEKFKGAQYVNVDKRRTEAWIRYGR